MVVFYALSGALQIFDLHESHGGYTAPAVLSAIGRLHKNQVLAAPPRRRAPAGAPGAPGMSPKGDGAAQPAPAVALKTLLLKWLFCIEALALAFTTVLGAIIGLTHAKRKRTIVALLAAGTLVPIVLLVV